MQHIPKVSVLMPAHNAEKYISAAIKSILNQTFKDFELLIIDDGSTDATWSIVERCARTDQRIHVRKAKRNMGVAITRNNLLKMARGKYIVWQDADDISTLIRLEQQYLFMEAHPDVGMCGGAIEFFGEHGTIAIQKYAGADDTLRRRIFRFSPVSQGAAIVRAEAYKKVGLFDTNLCQSEDLDMSFRIGQYYKFANLPEVVLRYRRHNGSISMCRVYENISDTLKVRFNAYKNLNYPMNMEDRIINRLTRLLLRVPLPTVFINWLFVIYRKLV